METLDVRLPVFVLVSLFLSYISRKSLRNIKSHGFFRLLAWECILALLLLNLPAWFSDPLSLQQIASWITLAASLLTLVSGVFLLRAAGKHDHRRADPALFPFEKTAVLVTSGVFRYIRHPLYASLLFLAWGAFLKDISEFSCILVTAATANLVATAKADEAECIAYFGPRYEDYKSKTKMFIPFVFLH